jgi:hypothetical protein
MTGSQRIRVIPQRSRHQRSTTWREVGWIFRDGEILTIERHGPLQDFDRDLD